MERQGRPPVLSGGGSWYFRTGSGPTRPHRSVQPPGIGRCGMPAGAAPVDAWLERLVAGRLAVGPDPVPAGGLGAVQAGVGDREEIRGGPPVLRVGRDPDRGADRERHPPVGGEGRCPERGQDPGRHARGVLARGLRQDQGELVAAVARRDVGAAERRADQLGDVDEDAVPVQVAEAVVHELEVVEVEHHDAQRPVRAHRADDLLGQALVQVPVVEEPGQRVPVGEVARRLVQARVLEGHRGLVGHRRGERDLARVGAGAAGRHELDEADRLALGDQRDHDEAAHAIPPEEVHLGRIRGRILRIDGLDHAVLEHLAGERVAVERVEVVHVRASGRREAAERPQPGVGPVPVADLGTVGAHGAGDVLRHQVRDGPRIEGARQRAVHVQQLPQLRREAPGLGEVRGAAERRAGLVGEDHQQPQVVVVELAQAELGQRDHADQLPVVLHRDDEHRLVHVLGPLDRGAALVGRRIVDAQRLPVERHPAGEPLADLRAQDVEVDLLVGADAALERDRDEVIGRIEQVDAGVVVIDDAPRLLDDGPADLLPRQARAHAPGGVLEYLELGLPPALRRAESTEDRPGREDRAADGEVEHDREVLERARSTADRPADDAHREDGDAGGKRDHVKARRTHRASMATARAPRGTKAGKHETDAASEPPKRAPVEGTGGR